MIRVFLSHSHADTDLAAALTDLMLRALPLSNPEVRCTSVPGHKLPSGAHTSTQLRREIGQADVVVGLVSAASLDSLYVVFELGARWGSKKPLLPLFAPSFDFDKLKGPLAEYSGLRCDDDADLHQFVDDLATELKVAVGRPTSYQRALQAVLDASAGMTTGDPASEDAASPAVPIRSEPAPTDTAADLARPPASDTTPDAEVIARAHCKQEWGDDFAMLKFCLDKQTEAIATLRRGGPEDVPAEVFQRIRDRAARDWPDDFAMRVFTEAKQTEAYRQTR